jgi:hypothetical protein
MVIRHTVPFALLTLALQPPTAGAQGADDCALAVPASLAAGSSSTLTGDNSSATVTGDFADGSPFTGAPVIWHAFTTTQCATVIVSFCGQDPVWGTVFGFLATDCPAQDLVFFSTRWVRTAS